MTVRPVATIGHPVLRRPARALTAGELAAPAVQRLIEAHGRDVPARVRPLAGSLFLDRVTDTTTLTAWEQFDRFHPDEFVAGVSAFVAPVGS